MTSKKLFMLRGFFLFINLAINLHTYAADETICEPIPKQTSITRQLARIKKNDQACEERKHVTILGAGIAGLTAAYELSKLGHTVEIIEASSRLGGRIWTHTFESTGQYGELGAMRIPASHDYTRYYIEITGLTEKLRPFITAHQNTNCFYSLRGQTCRMKNAASFIEKEYHLSSHEQKILSNSPPPEILRKHFLNALQLLHTKDIGIKITDELDQEEEWSGLMGKTFLNDHALELEALSLGEFLKRRVESSDAKELVGVATGLELWWDKAVTMFLREEITQTGGGLEEIAGGLSQLPNALAEFLPKDKVKIRLNTEVVSIALPPDHKQGVKLKTRPTNPLEWDSPPTNEQTKDEAAEFVISTIPFGVLRTMEIKGLSPLKMEAIRNLSYASSTKVLLHFKDRFWERGPEEERILGGASMSDQVTRCTYYPSDHAQILSPLKPEKPKRFNGLFTLSDPLIIEPIVPTQDESMPGVLLGSYNWGQDAIRLGVLPAEERAEVVLNELTKFHPEIRQYLHPAESHKSIAWDSYRWSRGAFCGMRPHDMRDYHHTSKKSEGNLYFAGEHCSLDPGWIQGAIKSSLDAVEELVQAKTFTSQSKF